LYEAHFGLDRRPFGETVDPTAYVSIPSRETVVRRVRYGLENGLGPALIFGPPGTGKTLLARRIARDLDRPTAHLAFPALPASELLELVAEELGAGPPETASPSPGVAIRRLRRHLASLALRDERPLLVIDEVHLIDDQATFEMLRLLLNFASLGPPDLTLLLVGGPDVLLRLPAGLTDRLSARCLLGPLADAECSSYIHGRLAAAGARKRLFEPDAIDALQQAADGLPRRLNRLADFSLLIAYAEGRPQPDARTVRVAAREADHDGLAA
jgi:type II secretory pathway predicted ATPase ExeA